MPAPVALYSAVDEELTHYQVDVDGATLTRRATVKCPAFVQYAWPHPSRKFLYVTSSNRGPGLESDVNHVSAWRIAPGGALERHGEPKRLPHRATHLCVDPRGRYILNAHNLPVSGITVHRIETDGRIGDEVAQSQDIEWGIYPHQVRVTPSGRSVIVVDRGNSAAHGNPEDPGALRSFGFENGVLSAAGVVAPDGGYGFGPRHVDFHTDKPWLYVSDEKRSQLYLFRMPGERIEPAPAHTCDTLACRAKVKPRQLAGTIHVHPGGRYVYVANRADHTVEQGNGKVFGGGENTLAVYAIDAQTGEPTPIQHAPTHAYHVRTFAFDPEGRILVAASIKPMPVSHAGASVMVPAGLSVLRVGDDGKLDFVRRYDVESAGRTQYWMGMVGAAE